MKQTYKQTSKQGMSHVFAVKCWYRENPQASRKLVAWGPIVVHHKFVFPEISLYRKISLDPESFRYVKIGSGVSFR
jgi:hypothetical protein